MEKQTKKVYEAPDLTVVSFKAEKGYATSGLYLVGEWDGDNRHNAGEPPVMDNYEVDANSENGGYWQW